MSLPLDLFIEVTTTNGTRYRWDANQAAGSRPLGFTFRTKIGEGFSDGSLNLSRRVDLDYPDLGLVDTVTVVGADGSVAYEGRVEQTPRKLDDSHSIGVELAGWIAHARDKQMTEIYVDRDLSAWGGLSVRRKRDLLAAGFSNINDGQQMPDPSNNEAGIALAWTGAWAAGFKPVSEAWYDAGATNRIGKIVDSWQREGTSVDPADVNWTWLIALSTDDLLTTFQSSGNLIAAGPVVNGSITATSSNYRYALLQFYYGTSPAGSDGRSFTILWKKLAVYGTHGLATYTGMPGEPPGVLASDVIKNIAQRWCPQLDVSEVQSTNYVLQHLAFKDPVDPYDAMLEVNKYHLWHLGVWENKTLTYRPYDLTDYDWEVRTDDPGTSFDWQGPSTDNVFNGITVTYSDVLTGIRNVLLPQDYPDLKDLNPANPWNQAGIDKWDKLDLSTPTLKDSALQIGRAVLAERNQPKAPGGITISGYVRDRGGASQPVWKVRAGDTIILSNWPNDSPRLIHETSYSDDTKSNSLSIDAPAPRMDAVLDRITLGFQAANLG